MKNQTITTPKGTAVFPKLNEPDRRFKPEGEYKVTLRLPDSEAKALIEKLNAVRKSAYEEECKKNGNKKLKLAPVPWGTAMNWDSETSSKTELKGFTDFKFALKAEVKTKSGKSWQQRVALFDSRLLPIPDNADPIGGGSVIRVNAEIYPWYTASLGFGISLRCRGVQVIELKTYTGGKDATSFGFAEEEGFVAATVPSESQDGEATGEDLSADF